MPSVLHDITDRFNGIDCLEEIPPFRLVKLDKDASGKIGWKLCGATDTPSAISGAIPGVIGAKYRPDDMTMYNIRACARWKNEFFTDCEAGAKVYTAAEGRVTKTPVAGAFLLGIASKPVRAPRTDSEGKNVYDYAHILQTAESLTKYSGT